MKRRFFPRWGVGILLLITLACAIPIPTTEPLTVIDPVEVIETVGLNGAERAVVRLRLLTEALAVRPGDAELLRARFYYNVEEWEPDVTQHKTGDTTRVTIEQGLGSRISLGDTEGYINVWDVGLARGVPIDLGIDMGKGTANLDLGGLSLTALGLTTGGTDTSLTFSEVNPEPLSTLRVTAGAGQFAATGLGNANFDRLTVFGGTGSLDLNFDGVWKRGAIADVKAGAGKVAIRVPATLGIRVVFSGTPISSVETLGFTERTDNVYVNTAYGVAPVTLTINLTSGVGAVSLISQ